MKKIIVLIITFFAIQTQAQLIQGEIKINQQSKAEISIKSNKIVNLYAAYLYQYAAISFILTKFLILL